MPGVMNADLEKAFGTTMGTIRKRAGQVKQGLDLTEDDLLLGTPVDVVHIETLRPHAEKKKSMTQAAATSCSATTGSWLGRSGTPTSSIF